MKGRLGGRYLPSRQLMLSGMGMVLQAGKSLTSSGEGVRTVVEGLSSWGGGIRRSRVWASPSTRMVLTRLYLAALRRMELIKDKYQLINKDLNHLRTLPCAYNCSLMADIINIHVGQAGIRISQYFWKQIIKQHAIGESQTRGNLGFFQETVKGYRPRSIFIDLDDGYSSQKIRSQKDSLHLQQNFLSGHGASGNFAEAYYHSFGNIKDGVRNQIRRNIQLCDRFSGFICNSSLEGAAGSGACSGILQIGREEYPHRFMQSLRLLPNLDQGAHPVQIYNSTFALNRQVEYSELSLFYDNAAINRQLAKKGQFRPSINQVNEWIGKALVNTTLPFRFSGSLNTNQRKIAQSLVLFPRMHFTTFSVANSQPNPLTQCMNPDSFMQTDYFTSSPQLATFTLHAHLADNFGSENQVVSTIRNQFARRNYTFLEWIADNIHVSLGPEIDTNSASVIVNGYHITRAFKVMSQLFTASFRRKAFIHMYLSAGMDEMQFTEAESNLNDLLSEYQPPSNYDYYDDEYDEYPVQ